MSKSSTLSRALDWTTDQGGNNIHVNNLTPITLTTVQTAANQSAQLALTTEAGDIVVRTDEKKTYCHNGGTASNMNDFTELQSPTDAVTSVSGATGVVADSDIDHDSLANFAANEHYTQASITSLSNLTSVGTLTSLTGGTGDLNWDSGVLFVDASNNTVGINNTNPGGAQAMANTFVVGGGSGDQGMTIYSANDESGSIFFADGTSGGDAYDGFFEYNHSTRKLLFGAGAGTKMALDSSGNLGIGTTVPECSAAVHFTHDGTAGTLNDVGLSIYNYVNANNGVAPLWFGVTDVSEIYHKAGIGFLRTGSYGRGDLIFSVDSSDGGANCEILADEKMRITSAGAIRFKAPSNVNGEQVQKLEWWNENGAGIMAKISCVRETSSMAPAGLGFYTSANVDSTDNGGEGSWEERMRINSAGNVGIGDTAPTEAKLSIVQTSNLPAINIDQDGASEGIYIDQDGNGRGITIANASLSDGILINNSNASNGQSGLDILHAGNGPAISIDHDGAGRAFELVNDTGGTCMFIEQNYANYALEIKQDAASEAIRCTGVGGRGEIHISNDNTAQIILDSTHTHGEYWAIASTWDGANASRVTVYKDATANFNVHESGQIQCPNGTLDEGSDERIKTNIKTIVSPLDKVTKMRGVSYDRLDKEKHEVGLIAQELELVAPELVSTYYSEEEKVLLDGTKLKDLKAINYTHLIAYLIEGMKEINSKVTALENA